MNVLSLFSGIGGLELGLERAGMTVTGQVELDPYCREVLSRHWPEVPRHDDVRTAPEWWQSQQRPCVDLVAGGFPCQPFSKLGCRLGIDDERWGWPWMANVVRVVRPRYVLVENVSALVRDRDAFAWMLGDLHQLGFDAQWTVVSACSVGAPHARDRLFLLAHPACVDGQQPLHLQASVQGGRAGAGTARGYARPERWIPEPAVGRVAHGLSKRVVAPGLRALGNAVVPHVAELVGRLIVTADTNWRHAA
ncbi:DNA cytosine methyltransferase [Lentzea albidocapillata]|uniref:DNA cytosine methyltransferase n=1 Tax=Lentzea albidocapillata TaxID=40571 RepID=UPI000A81588F|nr:DNA (cytosine-5-)-methyltransferase [Lentzea albidocapillata]